MLAGNRVSVVKNSFMGKMCFTPLSKKKTGKLLVLSGITPYRIVSIAILYSKDFLFLFWSYSIFKLL